MPKPQVFRPLGTALPENSDDEDEQPKTNEDIITEAGRKLEAIKQTIRDMAKLLSDSDEEQAESIDGDPMNEEDEDGSPEVIDGHCAEPGCGASIAHQCHFGTVCDLNCGRTHRNGKIFPPIKLVFILKTPILLACPD